MGTLGTTQHKVYLWFVDQGFGFDSALKFAAQV